jgi:hypothetical protein
VLVAIVLVRFHRIVKRQGRRATPRRRRLYIVRRHERHH